MKICVAMALLVISYQALAQQGTSIRFNPAKFFSTFSAANAPVLTVHQGDTVYTTTLDCNGFDSLGHKLTGDGGNPLTGPFYVDGAIPGDILKVTLVKVALNRQTAFSSAFFHPRSLPKADLQPYSIDTPIIWKLNAKSMKASPDMNSVRLENFSVNMHPFLGCLGVAPGAGAISTEDAGPFGGNMDFTAVTAGANIYLPVFKRGALLTLGDGHAAQGDGELNWTALETSLDVAFTVQLIKQPAFTLQYPRVENQDYLMAVGIDSSLDIALKIATKGLLNWVQQTYHLTNAEATQVLGSCMEYKIAEIVDPQVEIVAMIKKTALAGIGK